MLLEPESGGVQPSAWLPDPETAVTASVIVVLAVVLWVIVSLVQGNPIQPVETAVFALVFAVVYFGALSVLSGGTESSSGRESG